MPNSRLAAEHDLLGDDVRPAGPDRHVEPRLRSTLRPPRSSPANCACGTHLLCSVIRQALALARLPSRAPPRARRRPRARLPPRTHLRFLMCPPWVTRLLPRIDGCQLQRAAPRARPTRRRRSRARSRGRSPPMPGRRRRSDETDLHAERPGRSAEVVPHDGADHREYGRDLQAREDERQASGVARRKTRARRVGRMSSIDEGETDVRPLIVFTSIGKKQRMAAITILDHIVSPEPVVRNGSERDDRHGARRDHVRHEGGLERPPAREQEREQNPSEQPSTKPPKASLNVIHPARRSSLRASQNACSTSESGGSR